MSETVIERLIFKLDAETSGFSDRLDESQKKLGDFVEFVGTKPGLALGAAAAAMVALAAQATMMAAEVDGAMRKLDASLPDAGAGLGALRADIVALTEVTPRTQEELINTAKAIANMGETDPQEIAKNLRTLALAADALGDADMTELADQLDLIGDAFNLSAEGARQAYTQIVAMTKGKIDINDLAGAFARSAVQLKALGVGAVEGAAAMTALIDAGVSKRQVVSGVLDLLSSASKAEDQALDAEAAKKEGTAKALRILSTVMSKANVESKGLLGAMGELYTALGGTEEAFTKAGLSTNQFAIAQKAALAAQDGAKVQSYSEAVEKLSKAADINRESAAALSQVLKNELAAQLIDLGNVFLPPVIKSLTILADLFGTTRRAAKNAAIEVGFANAAFAKGDKSVGVYRTNQFVQNIKSNPDALKADTFQTEDALRAAQRAIVTSLNAPGYNGRQAVLGPARTDMINALTEIATKLREVQGAAEAAAGSGGGGGDGGGGGFRDTGAAASEAAEKLAQAREAASALFDSLGDTDAMTRANAQINAWARNAEKAKVPTAEIADTVRTLREAFQQAADADSAKKVAQSVEELTADLRALQAEASGSALDALDVAYDEIVAGLEKKAKASTDAAAAAEKLGNAESAAKLRETAKGYEEQVKLANRRRDGLKDLAAMAERAAKAQQIETEFTKAGTVAYAGAVPTIADLHRAEGDLLSVRTRLQEIVSDPATDPKVRAEAQQLLAQYTREEAEQTGEIAEQVSRAAVNTEDLGNGIQRSALAALSLVQVLGQGNSELAQMLASVANIGSGLGGLGAAASSAGGFGALFSSAGGIASALGPIGAVAGGVVSLVGVFAKQGEAARKRAEELRVAAEQFSANLANFVRDIAEQDVGTFAEQRNKLGEEIASQLADAAKASGLDGRGYEGTRQTVASLQLLFDSINEEINRILELGETPPDNLVKFARAIFDVIKNAEVAERDLRERQARQIAEAQDDLRVRALVAQGRTSEADALREQLAAQKALEAAMTDFSGAEGYQEYIRALKAVQEAEAAAAEATRQRTAAIAELDDTNEVLGGSANDKLTRALTTYGALFGDLGAIANGLELTTGKGLEALRERLREQFRAILEGGITDAEQPIVDAIKALLGNIDAALGALDDPFADALDAFGQMVSTFKLSGAAQAKGFAKLYSEQFADFAALIGPSFDPAKLDGSGLAALKTKIGDAITAILEDGKITDAEQPYLTALQNFFGVIETMMQEAADTATENAENAEAARTSGLSSRKTNATLDVQLGDLSGADAFTALLAGYSEQLSAFFATFNPTTLEGIDAAKTRLRTLRTDIERLTDEELLAKYGMTRDEILSALSDVDAGLDGLSDGLRDLAKAQGDFLNDLNIEFLNATGRGLDAVKLQTKLWVEQMIATAKTLNVYTPEIEEQIRAVGQSKIDSYVASQAEKEKPYHYVGNVKVYDDDLRPRDANGVLIFDSSKAVAPATPVVDTTQYADTTTTAQSVSTITQAEAMTITSVLGASLVEQRAIRVAAERSADALSRIALTEVPALRVPSLPNTTAASVAANAAPVTVMININGPILGQSATDAARQFAEAAMPYINEALARAAGVEARLAGGSIS